MVDFTIHKHINIFFGLYFLPFIVTVLSDGDLGDRKPESSASVYVCLTDKTETVTGENMRS